MFHHFPIKLAILGQLGIRFLFSTSTALQLHQTAWACGSCPDPADPVCVQTWPLLALLGEKAWPVQCRNELRHPGRRTSHAPSAACGSAYVGRAHSVYVRPGSVPWDSKTPKQFARKNHREEMKRIIRAAPWWKETIGKRHNPSGNSRHPQKEPLPPPITSRCNHHFRWI